MTVDTPPRVPPKILRHMVRRPAPVAAAPIVASESRPVPVEMAPRVETAKAAPMAQLHEAQPPSGPVVSAVAPTLASRVPDLTHSSTPAPVPVTAPLMSPASSLTTPAEKSQKIVPRMGARRPPIPVGGAKAVSVADLVAGKGRISPPRPVASLASATVPRRPLPPVSVVEKVAVVEAVPPQEVVAADALEVPAVEIAAGKRDPDLTSAPESEPVAPEDPAISEAPAVEATDVTEIAVADEGQASDKEVPAPSVDVVTPAPAEKAATAETEEPVKVDGVPDLSVGQEDAAPVTPEKADVTVVEAVGTPPEAKTKKRVRGLDAIQARDTTTKRERDTVRIERIRAAMGVSHGEVKTPATPKEEVPVTPIEEKPTPKPRPVQPAGRAAAAPREEDAAALASFQKILEAERRKMRGRMSLLTVVFMILLLAVMGGSLYIAWEKAGRSQQVAERLSRQLEQLKRDTASDEDNEDKTVTALSRSEAFLKKTESMVADIQKESGMVGKSMEADLLTLKSMMKSLTDEMGEVKKNLAEERAKREAAVKAESEASPTSTKTPAAKTQASRGVSYDTIAFKPAGGTTEVEWLVAIP